MEVSAIRNIAFVGHPSSGKTTLIDGLAQVLGVTERRGSVSDKTSLCDTEPEEHEKGHTLQMKVVHGEHDDIRWNLFDTPGYPDFLGDTLAGMFAADLVVGVVSASSGVTFNLVSKMRMAEEMGRGRAIVVTHLDGENANFDAIVDELREKLGKGCVPFQVPNESGPGFNAVSRLVESGDDGKWRAAMMDAVMDACEDEEVMNRYLEGEELTIEELDRLAPAAIIAGSVVPVLVCNPTTDVGFQEMLAFLEHFAPSPIHARPFVAAGEPVSPDPNGDFLGTVFAVRSDPHVGKVVAIRVLRGTLKAGDQVWKGEGKPEKLGGLFQIVGGKRRDPIDEAGPGRIVAFSKVEGVGFGDAVVHGGKDAPDLEKLTLPTSMVSLAVTPKSRADEQKIGEALHKLEAEDPTFRCEQIKETHELVAHGLSDLHLQVLESRLKRRFGVEIETALPKIAYKETVSKAAEGHHRHKKQSGGRGQFGECYIRIKPGAENSGYVFVDEVTGGAIPRNLIPAVDKGMREVCEQGVLTQSRVVDVEVAVYDGKFHAVDSDEMSFKKAGANAFRDAFKKAGPVLLEPVMEIEIHVPSESAGTVFSDLTSQRRGQVVDQSSEGGGHITVVKAHVPLATVLTYHRDLKSQTAGEGFYTMHLDHYARMPAPEQEKVLKTIGKKHEEE